MLKYDSMHGKMHGEVTFSGSDLVIDGKKIKTYTEKCVLQINLVISYFLLRAFCVQKLVLDMIRCSLRTYVALVLH